MSDYVKFHVDYTHVIPSHSRLLTLESLRIHFPWHLFFEDIHIDVGFLAPWTGEIFLSMDYDVMKHAWFKFSAASHDFITLPNIGSFMKPT